MSGFFRERQCEIHLFIVQVQCRSKVRKAIPYFWPLQP
jgi:hypothetical protein